MADDSTTETINTISGDARYYSINPADGSVILVSDVGVLLATSYFGPSPSPGQFSVKRFALQFVWPTALNKSPAGSMLDPPVLATASLKLTSTAILGSPKISFYVALEPEVVIDDLAFWPGPVMPYPAAEPDSTLNVYTYVSVMPVINDERKSVEIVTGEQTFTLDTTQLRKVFDDQPGKTAWDLNITLVGVLDDELDGYPTANAFAAKQVQFTGAISPELTVEHISFHTGFMTTADTGAPTREVRDGRFGMPALSMELVEDKYLHGIWVRSHQQDPDDGVVKYPKRTEIRTDKKGVR